MEEKKNIVRLSEGLHKDSSYVDQPKGTSTFMLNAVPETNEGNSNFRTNEESNEIYVAFPTGYTPIGKEYMGNGQSIVFLAKDDKTASEIGILDRDKTYTTHVNDSTQQDKLGFTVTNQISATYRLRRGCERTVYFVQRGKPPRYYNFDKPDSFKTAGLWDPDKFKLFKSSNEVPVFDSFDVIESGVLAPGSYNFAIQYLDDDLNPTEWSATSDTIIIYNDSITAKPFSEIRGSTNLVNFYQDFGNTSKAIRVNLNNLNTDFPFYRVGIIEATGGLGQITRVVYSPEISIDIRSFTYTGSNYETEGTEEEILQFATIIDEAQHIEQLENRLNLLEIKGKQVNWCSLQKYASSITADLVTEPIVLNSIETPNNQKRAQLHTEKVGYMPGEIYSFGIVYLFADGTTSPAYHIPGKASTFPSQMSDDNTLENTFYTDNNPCGTEDYWGKDSQGTTLVGEPVRHHRFPTRGQLNKPLFTRTSEALDGSSAVTNILYIDVSNGALGSTLEQDVDYRVNYTIDAVPGFVDKTLLSVPESGIEDIFIIASVGTIVFVSVEEFENGVPGPIFSGLTYTPDIKTSQSVTEDATYQSEIFGIVFSNIDIPSIDETNGEAIVGYYIVRNERDEDNKTILDSAVLTPLIVEQAGGTDKFVGHGHLVPNTTRIKDDMLAIIHPEHKFNGREYTPTQYIQEGEYIITSQNKTSIITQDVMPGTSYDSSVNKRRERDSDGFDLHNYVRNNNVGFSLRKATWADTADISETFYLDSLFSKVVTDSASARKEVFNLSSDNKIGILSMNTTFDNTLIKTNLPYVIMKRDLSDPYASFRTSAYYKEHANAFTGSSTNPIYNGDSYIGSMKYVSTMFYDIRLRERGTKSGLFNFVLGVLSVIAGTIITIASVGTAAAAGIALAGFGLTQIATGLKKEQIGRVYGDLYDQGLKDTVEDDDTTAEFSANPPDDEVQWVQDSITNLWFETSVNINWRMGSTLGLTDFLNAPTGYDQNQLQSYAIEKVTTLDPEADGGRTYQGFAKAEVYEVNPDFMRRDRQKLFTHLGIEYDCCSDCIEDFPHRVHYSEQSFQEELTDNYRVFLPNNYRDLEGETGKISNVYRIQNNLFIHTEEALWHLPQNIQERVTGEVVSFIGTGDFFSIPPRKILDDDTGHSAGTQHKWSSVKTPYGIFFVCESQKRVFRFDGNKLSPISDKGLFNEFKKNIPLLLDENYYATNKREFPFADNPSNPYGTGFISTYDSRKERVIFTKKDLVFTEASIINSTDYELCYHNGNIIFFDNYNATIAAQEALGWEYVGIRDIDDYVISINTDNNAFSSYSGNNDAFGNLMINFSGTVTSISVKLRKTGAPDHNIKAYLYDDSLVLQQTSPIVKSANTLASAWEWVNFTFNDAVVYNETLHFVVKIEDIVTSDVSNFVESAYDVTGAKAEFLFSTSNNLYTTYVTNPGQSLVTRLYAGNLGPCKMVFQKLKSEFTQVEVVEVIPNTADVVVGLDTSGSFSGTARAQIKTAVIDWKNNFAASNPNWTGNLYFFETITDTERWVKTLEYVKAYIDLEDELGNPVVSGLSNDLIIVSFVNENSSIYHTNGISNPIDNYLSQFGFDHADFISTYNAHIAGGGTFRGLIYPIVMTSGATGQWQDTNGFLEHVMAALKGDDFTTEEIAIINSEPNPFCSNWALLMTALAGTNPYVTLGPGLENYDWTGIYNRGWNGTGDVITSSQFQIDMDEFLTGTSGTAITEVLTTTVEYLYIDGTELVSPTFNDASWTMSYYLKKDHWLSWHSYLPNFYLHTPDRFYSWKVGNVNLWKHNVIGNYQNFYGVRYPFIIEYVSLENPINTGIWDFIKLLTEAHRYNATNNEFREDRFVTFNKGIFYNSRQCSGELGLVVKDTTLTPATYLQQQVTDSDNTLVVIDRNEKDWSINDIRDIRIDYDNPIWNSALASVQSEYFIDKVLNTPTMDANKNIYQLESFRDKYLVIRLIFDTFDDVKLIFNYSVDSETPSHR